MPKGVDHLSTPTVIDYTRNVQKSLMPKGVDHYFGVSVSVTSKSAEIFDAERR